MLKLQRFETQACGEHELLNSTSLMHNMYSSKAALQKKFMRLTNDAD